MKKPISWLLFSLLILSSGIAFADTQIDEGQGKDTSKVIFFVGRYARTTAIGTNGNMISKDRVVVWDKVSDDGVTIDYSTTSGDLLNVGVAMDDIPGSSRDNTAALDLSSPNWGRIQTWGKHASVFHDSNHNWAAAGANVCIGATAGQVTDCVGASSDNVAVGTTLAAGTSTRVDIFVHK